MKSGPWHGSWLGRVVALAPILGVWCFLAGVFAAHQEIWVDEATQLSGLTLDPVEVTRWLAGAGPGRFGIPDDRMPPLAYWIGWLWSRVFPLAENSLRAMGILAVLGAATLVYLATERAHGRIAAAFASLLLISSPMLVVLGVEIRAYPLFVLAASSALFFLVTLVDSAFGASRAWIGLGASCALACLTHFFGIVMSASILVVLLFAVRKRREAWKPWAITTGVVGLAAAATFPFVLASISMSHGAANHEPLGLRPFIRYAYRLLGGHPSLAVVTLAQLAMLAGTVALLGVVLRRPERTKTAVVLAVAGVGITTAMATKLLVRGFDSLEASYNVWLTPFLAYAAASAFSTDHPSTKLVARVGAGLLLAGRAVALYVLLTRASVFAHGAGDRLAAEVEARGGPGAVSVLHDGDGNWGHAYFPLRFRFGPGLRQYLVDTSQGDRTTLRSLPDMRVAEPPRTGSILAVTSRPQSAEDSAAFVKTSQAPSLGEAAFDEWLSGLGYRTITPRRTLMATSAVEERWLARGENPR